MTVEDSNLEVAVLEIRKLDLKPGDVLLLTAPEGWTPLQISTFACFIDSGLKSDPILKNIRIIMIPHGMESSIITPVGGFIE